MIFIEVDMYLKNLNRLKINNLKEVIVIWISIDGLFDVISIIDEDFVILRTVLKLKSDRVYNDWIFGKHMKESI